MFGVGTKEIIIIAVVLVLLFGAKKIPELAKGIGSGIKNLKKSLKEDEPENNGKAKNSKK